MAKVFSKLLEEEKKCGGCNYAVSVFYSHENVDIDKHGLCANCFMDMIVDEEFTVISKENKKDIDKNLKSILKYLQDWKEYDMSDEGEWDKMVNKTKETLESLE